jgi:hypothetical protein
MDARVVDRSDGNDFCLEVRGGKSPLLVSARYRRDDHKAQKGKELDRQLSQIANPKSKI